MQRPLQILGNLSGELRLPSWGRSCTRQALPSRLAIGATVGNFSCAHRHRRIFKSCKGFCCHAVSVSSASHFGDAQRQPEARAITGLSAAKISALPISPELQEGLQRLGIRKLADVQRHCLLRALAGTSLIVAARPGAGKTLAYLIPILQRFMAEEMRDTLNTSAEAHSFPFALILVPSRELARQVTSVAMALLPQAPVILLDPTSPMRQHKELLQHIPAKIVVSTPDRVCALTGFRRPRGMGTTRSGPLEPNPLSLNNLRVLVVDEADALLRRDYHSKIQFLYRAALGWRDGKGDKHLSGEGLQCFSSSLQLLCFSAVLTQSMLSIFETEFPQVEVLNLLSASKHGTGGELVTEENSTRGKSGDKSEKGALGSAILGAGVTHHICFIPSQSLDDALRDDGSYVEGTAVGTTPAPQKTGEQRRNQTIEEEHMEKERKMLALAETLRTYIPRVTVGERQPNTSNRGSAEASAKKSCTVDDEEKEPLPTKNLASDSLEALEAAGASAGYQQPPGEPASSTGMKLSTDDMPPQCIVFADSQEEVCYIKSHPLLDSWRISSVHSNMDTQDRQRAMQNFIQGDASVLVSTDVAARGLDIPSVVLVVHMHPPSTAETYTHRGGRAGRGRTAGTSVVLCSSAELRKLRGIEQLSHVCFERRPLPAVGDCQELTLRQLAADMLNVPYSQYAPLIDLAQRLHDKAGDQAFATVLLKLGGANMYSALQLSSTSDRSALSGKRGFVPLLLYDPSHVRLQGSLAARRLLLGLLPTGANPEVVGRVVKSVNGFVADVSTTYADYVVEAAASEDAHSKDFSNGELDSHLNEQRVKEAWVPVFHLEQLPRLLGVGIGRRRHGRRLPWTRMKLSVVRSKKVARRQALDRERVSRSNSLQLEAIRNMSLGSANR